ncbi:hypothetical protein H5410_029841 [Solanum commersonii]|uniref:Uncharacterized protein n=1 Tax=Solanum commersonii TaxID=4109 RepID=A0A9J5YF79_SOLCO|nr:hypothetical protein H5410_029841 [Solanum commersonii]
MSVVIYKNRLELLTSFEPRAKLPVQQVLTFGLEVANLIHILKKENDNLHREKKVLETRMTDFGKYCTSDIEENRECLDEISVSKSEEVVVDKIIMMGFNKSKKKVCKMWIVIAMSWCCFAAFITFWVMK